MKKFQTILSYTIIVTLTAFVFYSCEDDDICTDEGEVPRMVADMYYNTDKVTELQDTIYYWAYVLADEIKGDKTDTIQIENGVVNNESTFGVAVRNNKNKKVFYTITQGPDRVIRDPNNSTIILETIPAKKDRLILEYTDIGNAYTSKACGYGLTFKDVKISLVTKNANGQGNWIKGIETVNTEIINGSTTIIKLFADRRN